ncbi:MAG: hypothetical protein Q7P63_16115 [Verrucomicrobiota bacterium JB022]|nr:hypothetical protein [Verrucomicrobiota bacterium JB022]
MQLIPQTILTLGALLALPFALSANPVEAEVQEPADAFLVESDAMAEAILLLWELDEIGWESHHDLGELETATAGDVAEDNFDDRESVAGMQQMLGSKEWEALERLRLAFDDRCFKASRFKCLSAWNPGKDEAKAGSHL